MTLPATRQICVLVLGMHRSGTSALTRVLSYLGAGLPKDIMLPAFDNETGFWEPSVLVDYNDRVLSSANRSWHDYRSIDAEQMASNSANVDQLADLIRAQYAEHPLFVLKDPRVCRMVPLYRRACDKLGIETRALIALRHPFAVAASLEHRNGLDHNRVFLLLLLHLLEAERATRDIPRAVVSYEAMLLDWRSAISPACEALKIDLLQAELGAASHIDSFLSREHQHFDATRDELMCDPAVSMWLKRAYVALLDLAHEERAASARETLDLLSSEIEAAQKLFTPIFEAERQQLQGAHDGALAVRTHEISDLTQQLVARQSEIELLQSDVAARENRLEEVISQLAAADADRDQLRTDIQTRSEQLTEVTSQLTAADADRGQLQAEIKTRSEQLTEVMSQITTIEAEGHQLRTELERICTQLSETEIKFTMETARLQSELVMRDAAVQEIKSDNGLVLDRFYNLKEQHQKAEQEYRALQSEAVSETVLRKSAQNAVIRLQNELFENQSLVEALEVEVYLLSTKVIKLEATLSKQVEISNDYASKLDKEIATVRNLTAQYDELRKRTDATEQFLSAILASTSWQITAPGRMVSQTVRGAGRRVQQGAQAAARGISFTRRIVRATNTDRVKAALRGMQRGDWSYLANRIRYVGSTDRPRPFSEPISEDACSIGIPKLIGDQTFWISQGLRDYLFDIYGGVAIADVTNLMSVVDRYGRQAGDFSNSAAASTLLEWLRVTSRSRAVSGTPDVSIVIPVYNNLCLTMTAIAAILRSSSRYTYEIIVGDDCSTDETASIVAQIGGCVRHYRHDRNLGFLGNCNQTAALARGRFIVLLNNDTIALPGWLDALITPLAVNDDIGLSGSKLLNTDGTLQEAGGIFWKDGSAWNFGRNDDPRAPQYNYAKDVDYISGASIALRSSVWQALEGFDLEFAPAYCEDSDLAFRLRHAGLRVVYSPHSEVIHHEGMSHGSDTSGGIKAYQIINSKKLFARWQAELERFHFDNAANVFLARDRSRVKPHILIIDHYVPQWDRDAGSKTIYLYVRLFAERGFQVTFWPDNLHYDTKYVRHLQALGVEVIYGAEYCDGFRSWFRNVAKHVNYILCSRPHISIKFMPIIRDLSEAPIIYYGHDLHWKRHDAEYSVTKNSECLAARDAIKVIEDKVCSLADYISYPSKDECDIIRQAFPSARGIFELSMSFFADEFLDKATARLAAVSDVNRPSALFVGGFAHRPNADAIEWFIREVLPIVVATHSEFVIKVVGSSMPESIKILSGPNVDMIGWVSDEDLDNLYESSTIAIVPLRFGAGVKGKIIEAFARGLPVVSTSIGLQGIEDASNLAYCADTAEQFAEALTTAMDKPVDAKCKAERALQFLRYKYSETAAAKNLSSVFPELSGTIDLMIQPIEQ